MTSPTAPKTETAHVDLILAEGKALVRQASAALPHLNGQAYSSLLSQMNAFAAAISKAEGRAP